MTEREWLEDAWKDLTTYGCYEAGSMTFVSSKQSAIVFKRVIKASGIERKS